MNYERELTLTYLGEVIFGVVVVGVALFLLDYFSISEGWRFPIIFSVGIVFLAGVLAHGFQAVCAQVHVSSEFMLATKTEALQEVTPDRV